MKIKTRNFPILFFIVSDVKVADYGTSCIYGNSTWGDLLTSYNGTTINYDAIGNPTNWHNSSSLTWEGRQLVGQTIKYLGDRFTYTYNSDGIRTQKEYYDFDYCGYYTYDYVLDGSKIIQETAYIDNSKQYTLYYLYDASGAVQGFIYNNSYYYFQKNLQGDVVRILNSSGTVVTEYTYDAWGKVLTTTGTLASTVGKYNPFRYRSYYYDTETGFYYLQSRYYDPTVGRFLNADGMIGANGGIEGYNMFAYCNNNPVMYADETGYALKHNTVLINDGGGGNSYFNDVSSTDDQSIAVFYEYDHSTQFGSHTVEFDYMYQVQNGKIVNAEISRFEITEVPPFYTSQIIAADAKIIDTESTDGAIMFVFRIKAVLSFGIPMMPEVLSWLSIDIFEYENECTSTLYFNWED